MRCTALQRTMFKACARTSIALLGSLSLLSACATLGEAPSDPSSGSPSGANADNVLTATPEPASFSGNLPQAAAVGGCEEGSVSSGLWRVQASADDPVLPMSVRTSAAREVIVDSATGGVRKLDPSGRTMWFRSFGSVADVNSDGFIFVGGSFTNSLSLDARTTLAAAGGSDAYVAKLDAQGNVLFAITLGGAGDERAQ